MTPENESSILTIFFITFIAAIVIATLYVRKIRPFLSDRHYIKMELRRSSGREYDYWKRQLRHLYRTKLPIIGWFFR